MKNKFTILYALAFILALMATNISDGWSQNVRDNAGPVLYDQTASTSTNKKQPSNIFYDMQTGQDTLYNTKADGPFSNKSSMFADDFTVPAGSTWELSSIAVNGNGGYNQTFLNLKAVNVTIFNDDAGKPGEIVAEYPNITSYYLDTYGYKGSNNDLLVFLPELVSLTEGYYWIGLSTVSDKVNRHEWQWFQQNNDDAIGIGAAHYFMYSENNIFQWRSIKDKSAYNKSDLTYSLHGFNTTDVAVADIVSPANGAELGAAESVTVTLKNNGSSDITGFDVSFTTDGGATTVTETVTATIAPGDIYDFTFSTQADLSVAGPFTVEVSATLTGDENTNNDVVSIVVENYGKVFNIADYDAGTITSDNGRFVDDGGIEGYVLRTQNYVTTIIPETGTNPRSTLTFSFLDVNSSDSIFIYDGLTTDAPLLAFGKSTTKPSGIITAINAAGALTIEYKVSIYDDFDEKGWEATIGTVEALGDDAAIIEIKTPASGVENGTSTEPVSVVIKNYGANSITDLPVSFSTDNWTTQVDEICTGTILAGETAEFVFTNTVDLLATGPYSIVVKTVLVGDLDASNDSKTKSITSHGLVYRISDYDGQTITDDSGMFVDDGGVADAFSATSYTTTIKPASGTNPRTKLKFVSSFRINRNDTLFIYDGEDTNAPLLAFGRDRDEPTDILGTLGEVTATNPTGALTILFKCTGAGNISWGIGGWQADISTVEALADDAALIEIKEPASTGENLASETVTIGIKNYGYNAIADLPVSYSLDGWATQVDESAGAFTASETKEFTFTTPVNLSAEGPYTLDVKTGLVGDLVITNDSKTKSITNYGLVYRISEYDGQTITTDAGKFVDDGGIDNNYTPDTSYTTTIMPATGTNPMTQLTFGNTFYVYRNKDTLYVYDGMDITAPLLAAGTNTDLRNITVTASNPDGALTIVFKGNYSYSKAGWNATISTVEANANDVGIVEIITPLAHGENMTDSETVQVIVHNYGYNTQTDVEVTYTLDGGATYVRDTVPTIAAGEYLVFEFDTLADLSVEGPYTLDVTTALIGDDDIANDSKTSAITNYGEVYRISDYHNGVIETCSGYFTDEGGPAVAYPLGYGIPYSDYVTIIKSGDPGMLPVLNFTYFDFTSYEVLEIYDGEDMNAPLIASYTFSNKPVYGELIESKSGAFTIHRVSERGAKWGWIAEISCTTPNADNFTVLDVITSDNLAFVNKEFNISAQILNAGYIGQAKDVTFSIEPVSKFNSTVVELGTVNTGDIALGKKVSVDINWTPTESAIYRLYASVPDDDDASDNIYSIDIMVHEEYALAESFETDIFPPVGWSTRTDGWARTDIYMGPAPHGNYLANAQALDTLITPLLDIKAGDKLKYFASLDPSDGLGALNFGWIDGTTGEFHEIVNEIQYVQYHVGFSLDIPTEAVGQNYLAFIGEPGMYIDYIYGPEKFYYDYDLEAVDLAKDQITVVGEQTEFSIILENFGRTDLDGSEYTIDLMNKDGDVLIESYNGVALAKYQKDTIVLSHAFDTRELISVYVNLNMANDGNITNNVTNEISVDVYNTEDMFVETGDGTGIYSHLPMSMWNQYSVSQVIYTPEQIGNVGNISAVSYDYNFGADKLNTNIKIWAGVTDSVSMENGWIDASTLSLVYDGSVDIMAGEGSLYLPFQTPYTYEGGNLVLLVYKDQELGTYDESFTVTETLGVFSSRYQKSVLVIDPENLDDANGTALEMFPNTTFYIETKVGTITGTVKDTSGTAIAGADVTIDMYSTISGADGTFTIPNVLVNNSYAGTVTATGYFNLDIASFAMDVVNKDLGDIVFAELTTPANVAVDVTTADGTADVTWDATINALSYNIYLDGTQVATGVTPLTYQLTGLADATYTIGISAVFAEGESAITDQAFTYALEAPGSVAVDISAANGTADVTWSLTATAESFNIYLDDLVTPIATGVTGTTYQLTGLADGNYTVGVSALFAGNESVVTEYAFTYALEAPSSVAVDITAANGTADATWSLTATAESFNIYLDDMVTPIATGVTANTYQLTGLADGNYTIGVSAVFAGNESVITEQAFTYALEAPGSVAVDITAADGTAGVTWSLTATAESFNIYLGDMTTPIATGVTGTTYQLTGLTNADYTVGVSAVYAGNESVITEQTFTYVITGIDNEFSNSIKVYPNPTTGRFVVEGVNGATINILDINGRLIRVVKATIDNQVINVENLPNGTYIIRIDKDSNIGMKRFVISK